MPDYKPNLLRRDYFAYLKLQMWTAVRAVARAAWQPVVARRRDILLWPPQPAGDSLLQVILDQFSFYFAGTDIRLCYYTREDGIYCRWQMLAGSAPKRQDWVGRLGSLWPQLFYYRTVALQADRTWRGLTAVVPQIVVLSHWGDVVWPSLLRDMVPAHIGWSKRAADSLRQPRTPWDQARVAVVGSGHKRGGIPSRPTPHCL